MSNNETTYSWTNRETWAFWLHVSNDRGMYEMTREWAQSWVDAQNADAQDDYADSSLGDYVVSLWRDYLDTYADEYGVPLGDSLLRFDREVGSWWRIDHAEIGAAVREDLDD